MGQNINTNKKNKKYKIEYNVGDYIDEELNEIYNKKRKKKNNKQLKTKNNDRFKRSNFKQKFNKNEKGLKNITNLLNLIYDSNIDTSENKKANRTIIGEIFDVWDAFELIEPNNIENKSNDDIIKKRYSITTENLLNPNNKKFAHNKIIDYSEKYNKAELKLDNNFQNKNVKKNEIVFLPKNKNDINENINLNSELKNKLNLNIYTLTNKTENIYVKNKKEFQEKKIEKSQNTFKKPENNYNTDLLFNNYDTDNFQNIKIHNSNIKDETNLNNINEKTKNYKENNIDKDKNDLYLNSNIKKVIIKKNLIFNNFKTLNNDTKRNTNLYHKKQNTIRKINNTHCDKFQNNNNAPKKDIIFNIKNKNCLKKENNTNISQNNKNNNIYLRKNINIKNKTRAHSWDIGKNNKNLNSLKKETEIIFNIIRKGKKKNKTKSKSICKVEEIFIEKSPTKEKNKNQINKINQNKIDYNTFKKDFLKLNKNYINTQNNKNTNENINERKSEIYLNKIKEEKKIINKNNYIKIIDNEAKTKEKSKKHPKKPKKPPVINITIDLKDLMKEEKMKKILEKQKNIKQKPKKTKEIFDYPEDLKYNVFGKQYKFTYNDENIF